ncbi:MAG: cobalamin-dependent protein [Thermoleophilia bacterium]|nr:cobalamin-dependent protein [Thermoleophilia bacterium]
MGSGGLLQQLVEAVVVGNGAAAESLAAGALAEGAGAYQIIEEALIPAMNIVSGKYDRKEYYLPQMLISSDAFYAAFNKVKGGLSSEQAKGKGKVVIGVVEGDIHDIGKNLVKTVLEANGFICVDMGRDVPIEDYLDAVAEQTPDLLMLSTLMTPTMLSMKRTLDGLVEDGLRDSVMVAVGGGPISEEFRKKIGADFYGDNEKMALAWANETVNGKVA